MNRQGLLALDSRGKADRFVTADELRDEDPVFYHQAEREGLLDREGRLPYDRYFKAFESGLRFWEEIAGRPESIPLIDQLKLGKKIGELKGRVEIYFHDPSGKNGSARRSLKSPVKLSMDIWGLLDPALLEGDRFNKNYPILDAALDLFAEAIYQEERETDPEKIAQIALESLIQTLEMEEVIDCQNEKDIPLCEEIRETAVYSEASDAELSLLLNAFSALLVYESTYIYPSADQCLWDFLVRGIDLTYNRDQLDIYRNPFSGNPFSARYDPYGAHRIDIEAFFDPVNRRIALDASILNDQTGGGPFVQKAYPYKGRGHLSHEIGHALIAGCYPFPLNPVETPLKNQAVSLATYFAFLPADLYGAVFFNLYGHESLMSEQGRNYNPVEETHSRLMELLTLGEDFPELIRTQLRHRGRWSRQKISEVYEKLGSFRSIAKQAWNFQGHPTWAKDLIETNPHGNPEMAIKGRR